MEHIDATILVRIQKERRERGSTAEQTKPGGVVTKKPAQQHPLRGVAQHYPLKGKV